MMCSNCGCLTVSFIWWEHPRTGQRSRVFVDGWIKKANCSLCLDLGYALAKYGDVP
jgi:hypothetical protein